MIDSTFLAWLTTIGKASPHAIGCMVGLVASRWTPFVLLTVPAGIILVGGAQTISKWFAAHRDEVLSKLISIPSQKDKAGQKNEPEDPA